MRHQSPPRGWGFKLGLGLVWGTGDNSQRTVELRRTPCAKVIDPVPPGALVSRVREAAWELERGNVIGL